MPQEKIVIASPDILTRPCDLCGERFPIPDTSENFFPWEISVTHINARGTVSSTAKFCLCDDCFQSVKMEWDRLKKS